MLNRKIARWMTGSVLALGPLLACAAPPGAAPPAIDAQELMTRDLTGDPGREAVMMTVTYQPGGASLPHRHDAQVFVYVLEGQMRCRWMAAPR